MYPLFETVCVKNGVLQNVEWHQKRYETSYKKLFSKAPPDRLLTGICIPDKFINGLCKLRIFYNENSTKIEFEKYVSKKIKTLKLIPVDDLDYDLKYSDRKILNTLLSQKEDYDDVLITKKGKITDTSYANIVFTDKKKWFTPSTPLLKGTCRARLLKEKEIEVKDISMHDLAQFKGFSLINAMNDLDKNNFIKIENIF